MKETDTSNQARKPPVRVMVVDDEEPICRLVQDFLKSSQEFTCVAAFPDPIQTLEAVSRFRPDIVVLDIRLPGMSGLECMERMREAYPELKFLLVTGMLDTLTEQEKVVAWPANGFLHKPFTMDEFVSALRTISCGGFVRSGKVEALLIARIQPASSNPGFRWHFSPRETEIAQLLCRFPNEIDKQLADRLGMAITSFHTHLQSIYRKLEVHSRAEAVQKLTTPQS